MAKISPMMAIPVVVFAAFVGLALVGMGREDPESLPSAREGKTAPPEAFIQVEIERIVAFLETDEKEFGKYEKALSRFDYSISLDTTKLRGVIAKRIIEQEGYSVI